jgi:hypothetical protein
MRSWRVFLLLVVLAFPCVAGLGNSGPAAAARAKVKSTTTTTNSVARKVTANVEDPHDLTPAPSCPAGDTCETIAGDNSGSVPESGGTVQVGPAQNLGDNQWVYINTYGFTPGSVLHIDWCTDTAPLSTVQPLCLSSGYPLIANTGYTVQTLSDGTESLSYQVLEIDDSDVPFTGQDPGDSSITGTYFCNATNPCSVNIQNVGVGAQGNFAQTSGNTAVVPISFATSGVGCGTTAASVDTESEYGLEFLLPVAAKASCALRNPSIAFNTAADGLGAVTSLASGTTEVAFTDDPESTDQQQILSQGNYSLIPVALSANVVAFKAQESQSGNLYPLNSLSVTPVMAAGLVTGAFETPSQSDVVECKNLTCPIPPCLGTGQKGTNPAKTCSLYTMANYQPTFTTPQQFESFVRSDSSGSNGLLYEWMCNAPNAGVPVSTSTSGGTESVAEPVTGAQELEQLFATSATPLKTCPIYEQLPPEAQGSQVTATGYNDPNQQEIKMNGYVQPGSQQSNATAAFSSMNWVEAQYYGMRIATIQNASGAFVLPSPSSLDAAVTDGAVNDQGILTPNYTQTTDASAYPMPSVVYAAICSDAQPTAQATAVSDMLTQLLSVSSSSSTTLPEGFVPLPSALATRAAADISKDVVGGGSALLSSCPGSPGTGTTTGGGSSGSSGGSAAAAGAAPVSTSTGAGSTSQSGGTGSTSGNTPPVVTSGANGHSTSVSRPQSTGSSPGKAAYSGLNSNSLAQGGGKGSGGSGGGELHFATFSLSTSSARILLPLALLLGLLAFTLGGALLVSPTLRESVLPLGRSLRQRVRRSESRSQSGGGAGQWFTGPGRRW